MSTNIELSKTKISKMMQSRRFLGDLAIALAEAAFRAGIDAAKHFLAIIAKNVTTYKIF